MAGEAYSKRYGAGGFVDLPTQTTSIDSQFLNAVEAALVRLLGADPTNDCVMVWDSGLGRFKTIKLTASEISPSAAIAKTQLAPLGIVDADIAAGANIAQSKIAGSGIALTKQVPITSPYVTPAGCKALVVELWGGGGGGAGCASSGSTANMSLGPSGSAGAYVQSLIVSPAASYTFAIGAGGTAGPAGANAGGNGSDTTFGALIAKGGGGGSAGECIAGGTALTFAQSGSTPGGSSGDLILARNRLVDWRFSGSVGYTVGAGAPRAADDVLNYIRSASVGGSAPGSSPGGGGCGAIDTNSTARAGGAGAAGMIIVWEFY